MRTWDNTIQKKIDAFELMKHTEDLSEREEKTTNEGLSLFYKHFHNLWD